MTTLERFNEKWTPEPYTNCWLWTGSGSNYGKATVNGKDHSAHRLSWGLHRGEIPTGMCVLHHCDTPFCVNPDHLFLGTPRDNTQDCISKGREPRGDTHYRAKLNSDNVLAIRSSSKSQHALAREYGVSRESIADIKMRRTWRWL